MCFLVINLFAYSGLVTPIFSSYYVLRNVVCNPKYPRFRRIPFYTEKFVDINIHLAVFVEQRSSYLFVIAIMFPFNETK